MKIITDRQAGTWTLIPVTDKEQAFVNHATQHLKPGKGVLDYDGKVTKPENDDLIGLHFKIPGFPLFLMTASRKQDQKKLGSIRNTCYLGSGELLFLKKQKMESVTALIVTGMLCKLCKKPIIHFGECEWKTCEACRKKCEHDFKEGVIHGGKVDIGIGLFCTKCGIGKPAKKGEKPKTVLEHHLAVVATGINLVYPNGTGPFETLRKVSPRTRRKAIRSLQTAN